jgi:hypothetical protein
VATELGDIKILIDVDVTRFEASLNNAMSRATSSFNRMGAGMASSVNSALNSAFQQQYGAIGVGVRNAFASAFAAANQQQAQQMAQMRQNLRTVTAGVGGSGSTGNMTQVGQSAGSSFAIGFKSPILNAIGAIHSAIYGLKDIGQMVGTVTGFNMAANLGTIQSQISTSLRSTKQGAQITGQLQDFAMKTPFAATEVAGIGRKMLAMGTPGKELMSTISTLADATVASGGGASELAELSEFIAKLRMNPRAMDSDTLLGLVRTGAPLRQTAESMAGRTFGNEQEATMFLQSRLSGRGAKGVEELLAGMARSSGGSAEALGRTSMPSVTQRVSESAQSMLMGTSGGGLNMALGGMNLLADMMGTIGKLNSAAMGIPGLLLLVSTFGYLKNAFMQAKSGLDAFIQSLNGFTSSMQVAQARTALTGAAALPPPIPMFLNSQAQMMGQINPAYAATHMIGPKGGYIPIPAVVPPVLTPMQKISAGVQGRMSAMGTGLSSFFSNMQPGMAGHLLTGGLMMTGMGVSQMLATQQSNNIGNQKAMAESTRLQNALGGAASGAMLGNMIGMLFPGVGNIVGTIAGTLIGGAAGYMTSPDPSNLPGKALDENTKALNNATVAMTMLASSIIGAGPRGAGAVSAIELEMYMASRNNMMTVGIG